MDIKVKIHRLFNNDFSNIKGFASMTLDNVLAVHGIKIMMNRNGVTFVALPSARGKKDYYDVVHPLTADLRNQIQDAVLSEYKRVLAKEKQRASENGEELPGQIVIAENNVPFHEPEVTLFDADFTT